LYRGGQQHRGESEAHVNRKNILFWTVVALPLAVVAASCGVGEAGYGEDGLSLNSSELRGEKVTICHIPPGNPANAHEITIGAPAVDAHIRNHGDYLGACRPDPCLPPAPLRQVANPKKVTICHIPPGNPANRHTITIGAPAVPAHIRNHGDTLGPCLPDPVNCEQPPPGGETPPPGGETPPPDGGTPPPPDGQQPPDSSSSPS
jgi:hypothetical protein